MNTITTREQRQFEELLQDILSTYNCTFTVTIDQKSDWLECLIQNEMGTQTDMHLTVPALREILTTYEGRNEFEKALEERFRPDC